MEFSQEIFTKWKIRKSIYKVGSKVMQDILTLLYMRKNEGLPRKTLQKLYKQNNSPKKWCTKFGNFERQCKMVESNSMDDSCDITFSGMVIDEIFKAEINELNSACRENIDWLRNFRNKIAHGKDFSLVTESEMFNKLKAIYDGVGSFYGKIFNSEVEDIRNMLEEIFESKLIEVQNDIDYVEILKSLKKEKLSSESKNELLKHYNNMKILNPCTFLDDEKFGHFTVDKIFTDLLIDNHDESGISLHSLFEKHKKYGKKWVKPSVIVLKGLAGAGKTSLCRYFLYEWCKESPEVSGLNEFELVILIEARYARSKTLESYLHTQLLKNVMKQFQSEDIVPLLQDMKILFILDGFDDNVSISEILLNDILSHFSLNGVMKKESRIIITSRPEFNEEIRNVLKKNRCGHMNLTIKGFDGARLKDFTSKVFKCAKESDASRDKFLMYMNGRGRILGEHLKLPLTTALLIYLWMDNPSRVNAVTTPTQLFKAVFDLCTEKLAARIKTKAHRLGNKLINKLEELKLFLGQQAWEMLLNDKYDLTVNTCEEMESKCKPKGLDYIEILSAFLMCETDMNEDEVVRVFTFLHKTQMEYMTAAYLLTLVKERKSLEDIFSGKDCKKVLNVILFLVGHLSMKKLLTSGNVDSVFSIIKETDVGSDNYVFWWNLLSECNHAIGNGYNVMMKDKIREILPRIWNLNSDNVIEALKILSYTKAKPEELVIIISIGKDPYDIPEFLSTMKELRNKLKDRYHTNDALKIELYFSQHFESNSHRPSNEFLHVLCPIINLINFEGHLGVQQPGRELLNFCYKLKNLYVRIDNSDALNSLVTSLNCIKGLKKLCLVLNMPKEGNINTISSFNLPKTTVTIKIQNITDDLWIEKLVTKVTNQNGCEILYVEDHVHLSDDKLARMKVQECRYI